MICFAWEGFPQYAARCVGAFVKSTKERVVVFATRPSVPVLGMEEAAGCEVVWVQKGMQANIPRVLGEMPRCLISSAWCSPAFSNNWAVFRKEGRCVVGMVDNNYERTVKCFLNGIRFRLLYDSMFSGFLVPGNSGVRLLQSYGVDRDRIVKGMYRADPSLFQSIVPIEKRPRRMLFTGRLNERKNVLRMCESFLIANERMTDNNKWVLDICGTGELKDSIPVSPYIVQHGFVQPEEIKNIYQQSRCFVLPSLSEHWGVVVHEAALSGCMLLLSNRIGAAEDFLCNSNGCAFNPFDVRDMTRAFYKIMSMPEEEIAKAGRDSERIAEGEDLSVFVDGINYCLHNWCRD